MAKKRTNDGDAKAQRFGGRRDIKDKEDFGVESVKLKPELSAAELQLLKHLPWPAAWQQLPLNSCTAHAVAGAMWYLQAQDEARPPIAPSRMYLYYHSLVYQRDENVNEDDEESPSLEATTVSGVSVRNALKAAARYGACKDCYWAHPALDIRSWDNVDAIFEEQDETVDGATFQALRATPDEKLYNVSSDEGVWVKVYSRLETKAVKSFKFHLSRGYPVIFSFDVRESLVRTGRDGLVPVPKDNEEVLGNHAVVAIGYDDDNKLITARNSWGPYWGDGGNAHFPYEFFSEGRIHDAWAVHEIERADDAFLRQTAPQNPTGLGRRLNPVRRGRKK